MHVSEWNHKARELEIEGRIEEAIQIYENIIENNFEGNFAYDRLAIIYRRKKLINEEIRVLKKGIWVFENIVNNQRMDRTPKLKKFYERLNKAEKILGVKTTSYKLKKSPINIRFKKPKDLRINTRTVRGKALFLQQLDPYEMRRNISNLPLKIKISLIRKAVKQECNTLIVGYYNQFGNKYLAIKPKTFKPDPKLSFFSPHEKAIIVSLFGNIIGIKNPLSIPMGVIFINDVDAFVERSVYMIK